MQEERKDTLKLFAGLAFTSGLALATQGSSGLIAGFLNNIAGNMVSSYIEKAEYKKIQQLIKQPNPSDLNHDLQKLIVKAVAFAIRNIEILYKEKLSSKDQKDELSTFTKELLAEIKVLNDSLSSHDKTPIYKIIESNIDEAAVLKTFDLNVQDFPIINPDSPYPSFFQEQFQPNLKLCFGELLKDEKNRPALIAYQREIFQSIETGIDKVIEQNNTILEKLDNKKSTHSENKIYIETKELIAKRSREVPDAMFIKSIEEQIEPLKKQYAILFKQNEQLIEEVGKVKAITKGISKDLKQNWLEKNKAYVLLGGSIALLLILGLVYHVQKQPFTLVLNIEKNKTMAINSDYPEPNDQARLLVYLPYGTREKQLTFTNEIILNEIPANQVGASCKIELLDPYWRLSTDSVLLNAKNQAIQIEPNDALSTVSGRVLSRDGQLRIKDAKIIVESQFTNTDSRGNFLIELPVFERKPSCIIRVEKTGYRTTERIYHPGSDIEIRLEQ